MSLCWLNAWKTSGLCALGMGLRQMRFIYCWRDTLHYSGEVKSDTFRVNYRAAVEGRTWP